MKPYTFALGANQIMDASLGGEYFLLDVAPSPVKFEFFGAGNLRREETLEDALPGDWATPENGFASIKITNGAVPQSVRFYVARGRVGRFRVSVSGGINLDPEDARYFLYGDDEVMDGEAFLAGGLVAPVAAQIGISQLWNPAGSGRVGYLDSITLTSAAAGEIFNVRRHNAALVALLTQGENKNISAGNNGVLQFRQGAAVAGAGVNIHPVGVTTNSDTLVLPFSPAIRIAEGMGCHVQNLTLNTQQICAMQWREKLS